MWSSSRSVAERRRRRLLGWPALALALGMLGLEASASSALPNDMPAAGEATLRFLGMQVYHARLWADADFTPERLGEQPLTLELEYLRAFRGKAIAERSIVEMRRAGSFTEEQAQRWNEAMQRLFPDVRAGDRLTGVLQPGRGAEFHHNGRLLGRIDDPTFARLFFSIWLGPNTSEPGLRRQLLARWLDAPR
jgi:hypothetical protein